MKRRRLPALALGVGFGVALGANGCLFDCDCPPPLELRNGTFTIMKAEDTALVGGTLSVEPARLTVSYERPPGTRWEAVYRIDGP